MEFRTITDTENHVNLMGGINNITFRFPSFPLLTQPDEIREDMFCDEDSLRTAECSADKSGGQLCACIHRLKIKLNSIVEMIIIDDHPSKCFIYKILPDKK